jgi:transcriptional regulator with XRE-family HTH domain
VFFTIFVLSYIRTPNPNKGAGMDDQIGETFNATDRKIEKTFDRQAILAEMGIKLRDARIKAGLTQAQLAKKIGTQQQSIAQMEKGKNSPSLRTLMRVAEATSKNLKIELSEEKIIIKKKDPEGINFNAYLLVFWHDVMAKLDSMKEIDDSLRINDVIQHFLNRGGNTLMALKDRDPFTKLSQDKEVLYPALSYSYLAGASDAMEFLWKALQVKKIIPMKKKANL